MQGRLRLINKGPIFCGDPLSPEQARALEDFVNGRPEPAPQRGLPEPAPQRDTDRKEDK